MTGNRLLSDAQIDQMAAWREAGKSYEWIAQRFGVAAQTIRWQCLRVGADDPRGHNRKASRMPMETMRGGRLVRRFTPAEDEHLLRRQLEGATNMQIARELGRQHNSIIGRAMTLAMHADRAERASNLPATSGRG